MESLTGWLDTAAVPYMLAGSFASTLHGRPRSTQDVDFVIDPTLDTLHAFLAVVPQEDAYVDAKAATDALRARDMFNLIHLDTGWKAEPRFQEPGYGASPARNTKPPPTASYVTTRIPCSASSPSRRSG